MTENTTTEHPGAPMPLDWTPGMLRDALTVQHGWNAAKTGPDTVAVARAYGVSRRTVQRWLHADPGHERDAFTNLPPARRAQILASVRPPQAVLDAEASKRRYAQAAVERIALPRNRGRTEVWQQQGWLDRHLIVIVDVPDLPLRRASVTKLADDTARRLRGRNDVVDFKVYAHRFAAELAKARLLEQLDRWRVTAPASSAVTGRTETWLAAAVLPPWRDL